MGYKKENSVNFGYTERDNGVAISHNAEYAESVGKYPQHLFIKIYQMSKKSFEFLCDNGIIKTTEWHHTGKNFRKTDYYEWSDFNNYDYSNAQCEEGSYGYIYAQNKKTIDNLLKVIMLYKYLVSFEKAESIVQYCFEDYCFDNWKDFLSDSDLRKYNEEQRNISYSEAFADDRFARKQLHQELERVWRNDTIKSKKSLMREKYNEKYVIPNKQIEERYKDIYTANKKKYEKYISEISTDATSGEFQIFSVLNMFFNTYDSAMKTHQIVYEFERQKIADEISKKVEVVVSEKEKERQSNIKKYQMWLNKNIESGNVKKISRASDSQISDYGELFVCEYSEQYGKYGWFASRGSWYNLPEYHTGYLFKNKSVLKKYNEWQEKAKEVSVLKIQDEFSNNAYDSIEKLEYFPNENDLNKVNLSALIRKRKLTFWF